MTKKFNLLANQLGMIIEKHIIETRMWIVMVLILLVKSEIVLYSLYGASQTITYDVCIAFLPILCVVSFSFCLPPKGSLIYLVAVDAFISTILFIDMIYARAFGHLISINIIFAGDAIQGIENGALSLIQLTDLLMLIDLPFFIFLIYKFKKRLIKRRLALFAISFITSVLCIAFGVYWIEANNQNMQRTFYPLIMSPIGNHMYDLYQHIHDKNMDLDTKELWMLNNWTEANKKYLEPDDSYASLKGLIKGKNIITIQFESLESFVINSSYYNQEITPTLNDIIKQSIYFDNIVEQVQDGNSSDAELIYNTSLYPIKSGSAFIRFGENDYDSFPKLLKQLGYTSKAIHGDSRDFWNRDQVFPLLGFDSYIDESKFQNQQRIGMGLSDQSLFQQTLIEIDKMKQPFNIFTITLTSHMPFEATEEISSLILPNDDVSSQYLKGINYTDKELGTFVGELEDSGLLKNTILVIYGDHEGVHKFYDSNLPDDSHKVPFIIYIPGFEGFQVDKIGGQIDMMPTLAFLLGIDEVEYADSIMGRNLFGKYSGSGILASGEIIDGTDGAMHLLKASDIADMYIRSDYYSKYIKKRDD